MWSWKDGWLATWLASRSPKWLRKSNNLKKSTMSYSFQYRDWSMSASRSAGTDCRFHNLRRKWLKSILCWLKSSRVSSIWKGRWKTRQIPTSTWRNGLMSCESGWKIKKGMKLWPRRSWKSKSICSISNLRSGTASTRHWWWTNSRLGTSRNTSSLQWWKNMLSGREGSHQSSFMKWRECAKK